MFRDSDYNYPRKHESFTNKPIPILQQQQQLSKFDEGGNERNHVENLDASMIPEIPTTYDTRYDPDDPRADWTVRFVFC